jgi:hypothetical protein
MDDYTKRILTARGVHKTKTVAQDNLEANKRSFQSMMEEANQIESGGFSMNEARSGGVDESARKKLSDFIENDFHFYNQMVRPNIKNLGKRKKKGTFDKSLAMKAMLNVATEGAKAYMRKAKMSGNVDTMFNKRTREAVAQDLWDFFEEEIEDAMNEAKKNPTRKRSAKKIRRMSEASGTVYANVVYMQGSEADEVLDIIDQKGEKAGLKHLEQWDYGDYHDIHKSDPTRSLRGYDKYETKNYIMTYNTRLGDVGLYAKLPASEYGESMSEGKNSLMNTKLVKAVINSAGLKNEVDEIDEFDVALALWHFRHDYNENHPLYHEINSMLKKAEYKPSRSDQDRSVLSDPGGRNVYTTLIYKEMANNYKKYERMFG